MNAPTRTERLHYDDPLALSMTARVLSLGKRGEHITVTLDRTVFYPESGGQMGDHGHLDDARVIDVQIDERGAVQHVIEGAAPAVGDEITGVVDAARRRRHMALHSGQHALSRAVLDALGAVTVSSRLGESACTLDVNVANLTLDDLHPVEAAVNRLIDEDRSVRQRFVDDATLATLALRKPPSVDGDVRVVEIDGYDVTPCGGTHVTHTAQIELLHLTSVERYKGGSRITFEAGPRARDRLEEADRRLRALSASLRCAPPEAPDVVAGLQQKLQQARDEAGVLRAQLADRWAASLPASERRIVATLEPADPALLKLVAERALASSPPDALALVVLAATDPAGTHVLVACPEGSPHRAGDVLRAVAARAGGRGGGRPQLAQGRLPAGVDVAALVREVVEG